MLIPLLNLHAKIMESIVSGSSSFPHDTRVYVLVFPLFCLFSVQAPAPQEGGVKAEVFSDPLPPPPLLLDYPAPCFHLIKLGFVC